MEAKASSIELKQMKIGKPTKGKVTYASKAFVKIRRHTMWNLIQKWSTTTKSFGKL